jgi:hypothetical protein
LDEPVKKPAETPKVVQVSKTTEAAKEAVKESPKVELKPMDTPKSSETRVELTKDVELPIVAPTVKGMKLDDAPKVNQDVQIESQVEEEQVITSPIA